MILKMRTACLTILLLLYSFYKELMPNKRSPIKIATKNNQQCSCR